MSSIVQLGYHLSGLVLDQGDQKDPVMFQPRARRERPPLISCVMPTRGRIFPARYAIQCFRRQSYQNRELVVVCASPGSEVEQYLAELGDPRIRFFVAEDTQTVGDMRNFAADRAEGELICVWGDDDLSHPDRLVYQLSAVEAFDTSAAFLKRVMLWWPEKKRLAVSEARLWENSMLVRKSLLPAYPSMRRGSDTVVVLQLRDKGKVVAVDHPASYCYVLHGTNLWGSDHFESFFANATLRLEGPGYDRGLADLSRHVPITDYASNHFPVGRGPEAT